MGDDGAEIFSRILCLELEGVFYPACQSREVLSRAWTPAGPTTPIQSILEGEISGLGEIIRSTPGKGA